MEGSYGVFYRDQQAGRVSVQKRGLYYHFVCRCKLPENTVFRLVARWETTQENLGVLVPVDDGFGLETKQPVKRMPKTEPRFALVRKCKEKGTGFSPIYPEEPFAHITRLKDAFLIRKNGQIGVGFK